VGSHGRIGRAHPKERQETVSNIDYPGAKPGVHRKSLYSSVRTIIVLLTASAGCVLAVASPALAGQRRLLTGVFGAATSTPANPYPLESAGDVAVDDETHDVYVVDTRGNRVEKFDSAGHFILTFGKQVNRTTGSNICTAISGDVCQAGVAGSSPGAFEFNFGSQGLAVDNSGIFGQGDIYVVATNASRQSTISKFNSEGEVISSWGNNGEGYAKNGPPNGQLNGSNATGTVVSGPFGLIGGIATDPLGNLWVNVTNAENNFASDVFEFHPSSSFVTSWSARAGKITVGFTGNEDKIYTGGFEITEYKASGSPIGPVSGVGGSIVIDQVSNELYIEHSGFYSPDVIDRFAASCHPELTVEREAIYCIPEEAFGANNFHINQTSGIAIDPGTSANTLYAAEEAGSIREIREETAHPARVLSFAVATVPDVTTAKASGFSAGSATLSGTVDPDGVELESGLEGCRFEWGEHGPSEPEPYGHSVPCDETAAQIGAGSTPVEVHADISGLQQGSIYHFRLVAGNHNQVNGLINEPTLGSDLAFGPSSIENASAIEVGAASATVQAQVDPNNVDTSVSLEYGTEVGVYDKSASGQDIGSGGTGQKVSFPLADLAPGTVYHYRVIASNALGEGTQAAVSADYSFVTQRTGGGLVLPDGRAWEMVSPPDKRGGEPDSIFESGGIVQASAAGDAITYLVTLPTEIEPAGSPGAVQVLSRRTASGWASSDIALPHGGPVGAAVGYGSEYRAFSSDLSSALVQSFGSFDPQVSVEASEQTPFLRSDYPSGQVEAPCVASCYRPLVTGAAGYENVPAETVFAPTCKKESICGPKFVGASPNLKHIVLSSPVALVEGAPVGKVGGSENEGSLYEWSAGKLELVSILPGGQPSPASEFPSLGLLNSMARNAVSADGSRVVWSSAAGALYVRDLAREETVRISSSAEFQTADGEVSRVLFTEKGDLRECHIVEDEAGELTCETSDLSPAASGEAAGVQGLIPGASEDASYVYFVANGVLRNGGVPVPGAKVGDCGSVRTTTCNLYVNHDGSIKLVTILSGEDYGDWVGGGGAALSTLTARVSPDGQWFAFMSAQSLTGYDNRDSVTGSPDAEVYLYDATANNGEGSLVCASCNPTGGRPHGHAIPPGDGGTYRSIAASVPGWTPYRLSSALYQSRYLSDSGRLFFDSYDALVPQDSNGTGDVYEYEPPGVGDCTTSDTSFTQSSDGCVGLISSGTSKEASVFVDASESGNDVFFLTAAQLVHADTDSALDVYDARVDGGFAEPSPPPACEGDACQSPISAPEDQTPGSLTYSGPSNPTNPPRAVAAKKTTKPLTRTQKLHKALTVCKRDKAKSKHNACVRLANKRYGSNGKPGKTSSKKGRR
jgi:hypothetical protein